MTDFDDADDAALALTDQPICSVTFDGDHDHTGVPCRTCVLLAAEDWSMDRLASAMPYGDVDRDPGEDFLTWRRRFAALIVARLARPARPVDDR